MRDDAVSSASVLSRAASSARRRTAVSRQGEIATTKSRSNRHGDIPLLHHKDPAGLPTGPRDVDTDARRAPWLSQSPSGAPVRHIPENAEQLRSAGWEEIGTGDLRGAIWPWMFVAGVFISGTRAPVPEQGMLPGSLGEGVKEGLRRCAACQIPAAAMGSESYAHARRGWLFGRPSMPMLNWCGGIAAWVRMLCTR
jgi:hypothetical protein